MKRENRAATVVPFQLTLLRTVGKKRQVSSCRNGGIRLIPDMGAVMRFIPCAVFHVNVIPGEVAHDRDPAHP